MKSSPKHEGSATTAYAALDQIPEIMFIATRKGDIVFANETARSMFQALLNGEKANLQSLGIDFSHDGLTNAKPSNKYLQLNNRPFQLEVKSLKGNHYVLITCRACTDKAAHLPQALNNGLKEVPQVAKTGTWRFDRNVNVYKLSDEIFEILEIRKTESPDPTLSDFFQTVYTEDILLLTKFFQRILEGEKGEIEFRILVNKKIKWLKVVSYPEMEQGKPFNEANEVIGIFQDITHLKNNDEEANVLKREVINRFPGAVYWQRSMQDKSLRSLDDQVKEILGYAASEFAPQGAIDFFDLVHEGDRQMLIKELSNSFKNRSSYEVTYRVRDKSNNEKWIWDKGGFMQLQNEQYVRGFMVDITTRIKVEKRILSATLRAEDAERTRISRAINDGVQQTLVSSMLYLQGLDSYIERSNDPKIKSLYTNGMEMLKSGVGETRDIAYDIMPKSIQDFGLIKTLESMIQSLNSTSPGIHYNFYTNFNQERLSERTETCLYKICREAVNNILTHAAASEVSIQVTKHCECILLHIEDNGRGFDTRDVMGFGISAMKSRATAIGGTFEIESRSGKGTCITVEVNDQE